MPCDSSYMDPTQEEDNSRHVCQNLGYVLQALNRPVPHWIKKAAKDPYGNTERIDEAVRKLCALCEGMTEAQQNKIIYDGRIIGARRLADWWDEHQEFDEEQRIIEKEEKEWKTLRASALKKLNKAEKEALGLE